MYGFPMLGTEEPINPRIIKGHIQAQYDRNSGAHCYKVYELSFPSFPRLSGSPVFCDWRNCNAAIGIVTNRIKYSTEEENQETSAHLMVAARLHPLIDWIESL